MVLVELGQTNVSEPVVDWQLEAFRATYSLCQRQERFTVEDLRASLAARRVPLPSNPAGLASVLRKAQHLGWCAKSPETVPAIRSVARGRKVHVWISAGPRTSGMALPEWDGTRPRRKRYRKAPPMLSALGAIYVLCSQRDIISVSDVRALITADEDLVRRALAEAQKRGWCLPSLSGAWRSARILPEWDGVR